MRERMPVLIADVREDPLFAPYLGIATAAGLRAVRSMPLIGRHGEPIGVLNVHFRRPCQLTAMLAERLERSVL